MAHNGHNVAHRQVAGQVQGEAPTQIEAAREGHLAALRWEVTVEDRAVAALVEDLAEASAVAVVAVVVEVEEGGNVNED